MKTLSAIFILLVVTACSKTVPPTGAPMTYMVNGKQYISIASMTGKDARLITLALP